MTAPRSIGADAVDSTCPWRVPQNRGEVLGMSTIDHEVSGIAISCLIDPRDCFGQALAVRQGAVGLYGERDDDGQSAERAARTKPAASLAWLKVRAVTMSASVPASQPSCSAKYSSAASMAIFASGL
jgi:hypothetical protein